MVTYSICYQLLFLGQIKQSITSPPNTYSSHMSSSFFPSADRLFRKPNPYSSIRTFTTNSSTDTALFLRKDGSELLRVVCSVNPEYSEECTISIFEACCSHPKYVSHENERERGNSIYLFSGYGGVNSICTSE